MATMSSADDYNDDYPTCARTFATLRILLDGDPQMVTERLNCEPTKTQLEGPGSTTDSAVLVSTNGWFLSSEAANQSKDVRRHLDWVLDAIEPRADALRSIRSEGARIDVCCYWVSAHGSGGPTLSAAQMKRLAELGLDCWFDIYHPNG